ncbi:hypothetical protein [Treponema sp. OMZ 906]|uniref:hypothetical protein n=1 Tax=Treponema sp. OMZ 906 TaxID=2563662 RepID=UPI0020A51149|nr:hypothetical protein [Treponema sp. OMZ 906]UTC55658.1 hypothetical protein E4N69_00620 [Treponema sp. OMZ 906]
MKHIAGRIVAYTVLYCSVIFGIFVLQFTKGQTFSLTLGSMTVTGRQERAESGKMIPLLPLHVVSNGLNLYISEQNPVYAVDEGDITSALRVLAYQFYEAEARFSVHCSDDVVISFFSERRGDVDSLMVEAVLPEGIKRILLPWKITQNAGIERADGKIFVRSGKKQYTFTGSFGFDTDGEDTAAQFEEPHLVLAKGQPFASYKTYLPLEELDITTIPSMVQASAESYTAALNSFSSAVVHAGTQALSSKRITEKTLIAYIAEMGQRGKFAGTMETAPAQTLARNVRTYLSNPFYDNVQETHVGLIADDAKKRERYAALITDNSLEIFEQDGLIPFLTDRGSRRSIEGLFRLIEKMDVAQLNARQAAGVLEVWLDCTHYYPERKTLFEDLLPVCEKKITDALLLIDEGLYMSNDGTYIDSVAALASARILMRYGTEQSSVWQSVARMLVTSLLRYSGELAGLPVGLTVTGSKSTQLVITADDSDVLDVGTLYPLLKPDNSWYPHAQSLALQAEAGIWAWTCAQNIEVLENTSKTLVLRIRFPEGQSHYLTLHGIRPFYRIEMYGIPFRSDARFEMYNSSGYAYNAGSKTLYLKMRHKSEYETIRLLLGSAPQESASVRPVPPAAVSNTSTGAAPSTEAASSNQAAGTTGVVSVPQPENPAQPEDAE